MYKYILMFFLGGILAYILCYAFQSDLNITKTAEHKAEAIVLNYRRQLIPERDYVPDIQQKQLVYKSNECIKKELIDQLNS